MFVVTCILRVDRRRAKDKIGCPQERKVLRKDLAMVSSRGNLGRCIEGSACARRNFVSAKDNRTLLFLGNGHMISMNKKNEGDL
jgi:hypothetical protein